MNQLVWVGVWRGGLCWEVMTALITHDLCVLYFLLFSSVSASLYTSLSITVFVFLMCPDSRECFEHWILHRQGQVVNSINSWDIKESHLFYNKSK